MKYLSTRGHAERQSFCDILLGGLAPDGGLYLPESYPQISRAELDTLQAIHTEESSDEISFHVPNSWKKVSIPSLSDTPLEIDDPQATIRKESSPSLPARWRQTASA